MDGSGCEYPEVETGQGLGEPLQVTGAFAEMQTI